MRELHLDGAEITVLKAMGRGSVSGDQLAEEVRGLEEAELIDTLQGLIMQGLVDTDISSFYNLEEMKKGNFQVNSGYSRELKEALDPRPQPKKSRRVRRE
jgi:hypothetical protein